MARRLGGRGGGEGGPASYCTLQPASTTEDGRGFVSSSAEYGVRSATGAKVVDAFDLRGREGGGRKKKNKMEEPEACDDLGVGRRRITTLRFETVFRQTKLFGRWAVSIKSIFILFIFFI